MSASNLLKVWALRLILPIIIGAAWWYGSGPGGISRLILPEPREVAVQFYRLFGSDFVVRATAITVIEIIAAFALAALGGLAAGFLLSRTSLRAKAAEPVLAWAYMFPFVLLYPLFLLWMGVGMSSKIAYAAVAGGIPIAYNTLRGLQSVDPRFTKVGIAFGASKFQMDRHVKVGAAWPMVLSGLRVGISVVLIGVVLAELLGSNVGLGFELQRATNTFQNARAFALVLLLILVTTLLQWILERLVNRRR